MPGKARRWCFTWNNPDGEPEAPEYVRFMVYQRERGAQGTEHFQGYIECKVQVRLGCLKQWLGHAHWEIANGDYASNLAYCTKEEGRVSDPVMFGEHVEQGRRTDLQEACITLAESGLDAVAEQHPAVFVKYHRGLEALWSRSLPHRSEPPTVWWLYGPTEVGKSRFVQEAEDETLWWSGESLQWFQDYHGQEAACFDDFRGDFCKFHTLLRLLDRYPYFVPLKGGSCKWIAKRIYITTCKHPGRIYANRSDEDMKQLYRRINYCFRFIAPEEVEQINLQSDEQLYD